MTKKFLLASLIIMGFAAPVLATSPSNNCAPDMPADLCKPAPVSKSHNDAFDPATQMAPIEVNLGQSNSGMQQSKLVLKHVNVGEVETNSTSVGNNVSLASIDGGATHAHVGQLNSGFAQIAVTELSHLTIKGGSLAEISTSAVGNNISIDASAGGKVNTSLAQCNTGIQSAGTSLSHLKVGNASISTSAVGNNFAINVQ